jgi:hypothetical protein
VGGTQYEATIPRILGVILNKFQHYNYPTRTAKTVNAIEQYCGAQKASLSFATVTAKLYSTYESCAAPSRQHQMPGEHKQFSGANSIQIYPLVRLRSGYQHTLSSFVFSEFSSRPTVFVVF